MRKKNRRQDSLICGISSKVGIIYLWMFHILIYSCVRPNVFSYLTNKLMNHQLSYTKYVAVNYHSKYQSERTNLNGRIHWIFTIFAEMKKNLLTIERWIRWKLHCLLLSVLIWQILPLQRNFPAEFDFNSVILIYSFSFQINKQFKSGILPVCWTTDVNSEQ